MPYQLIYTSSARLLDSALSGYGVVARTESMPMSLVRRIVELSELKEPVDEGILGAQFSYRTEECGGRVYHILTSARPAGADYSQRSCHIAHHLIFKEEEVQAISSTGQAYTPAGIALAMELRRLWVRRWQQEPTFLPEALPLSLEECPSTDQHPTWLIFSGNMENARALHTPPFHRGGLVLVPASTRSRDILRLMHESDADDPHHGWDIPFCTYSVNSDSLSSKERLFSIANSPLHLRAEQSGIPTLPIRPGLTLPTEAEPPSPTPEQQPSPVPQKPAATLAELPASPEYRYVECPDTDTFEKRKQTPGRVRKKDRSHLLLWGSLLIIAAAVACYKGLQGSSTSQPDEQPFVSLMNEQPAEAPQPTAPQEQASEPSPAPAQELNDTPAAPAHEPEQAETSRPDESLLPEDDEDPFAAGDTDEAESGAIYAITCGKSIPAAVQALLAGDELQLDRGEYIVNILQDAAPQRYALPLQAGKAELHLKREKDHYIITPIVSDSTLPQLPVIVFHTEKGILKQICAEGKKESPAAIQLPLMSAEGKSTLALLIPEIKYRYRAQSRSAWPESKEALSIRISDEMLISDAKELRLTMRNGRQPAWARLIDSQTCALIPNLTFSLPVFSLPNEITSPPANENALFTCTLHSAGDTGNGESVICTFTQRYSFRQALRRHFRSYVNAPVAPQLTNTYTLAHLYYVISSLGKAKNAKQFDDIASYYATLFRQQEFASYVRHSVFKGSEPLMPTPAEVQNRINSRNAISKELRDRLLVKENQAHLLERMRILFAEELGNAYTAQREKLLTENIVLGLRVSKVRVQEGTRLIWSFELKPPPQR